MTTIVVQVPVIAKRTFVILESTIENYGCDNMKCDGCRNDMGASNPKGMFRTIDGWFKLCHACLITQGFLTE